MLIRRMPALNHIFEELYHVNPMIEQAYIKLKVMEILLTMQTIPFSRESSQSSYFRRSDMDKVKACIRRRFIGWEKKFRCRYWRKSMTSHRLHSKAVSKRFMAAHITPI